MADANAPPRHDLIDEYRLTPERRVGTATFTDLASFCAHAVRFASANSAIFAADDKEKPSLTCVLDYHDKGHGGTPRHGAHRGTYAFPLSDEWTAWTAKNGQTLTQSDLAVFLEDRLGDVSDPATAAGSALDWSARLGASFASPSKLLELSKGLSIRVNATVREQRSIASGEGVVYYATENQNEDGTPLSVPSAFLLGIPVFRRGDLYPVPVRLRYRIRGGSIAWSYEMARVDAVFDHAFAEALAHVEKATTLPVYRGTPEPASK